MEEDDEMLLLQERQQVKEGTAGPAASRALLLPN